MAYQSNTGGNDNYGQERLEDSGGMGSVRSCGGNLGCQSGLDGPQVGCVQNPEPSWVGDDLDDDLYPKVEIAENGMRVTGEWVGVDFEGDKQPFVTQDGIGAEAPEIPRASVPRHQILNFPAPSKTTISGAQAPSTPEPGSPLESIQAPMPGIGAEDGPESSECKVPIHELNIIGWNPSRSGHGRSIRFKLGTPAPDTGFMSRYYTWVPEEKYEEWKRNFTIEGAINASRNKARLLAALRKRTG